jgi:hypothetical protein
MIEVIGDSSTRSISRSHALAAIVIGLYKSDLTAGVVLGGRRSSSS